MAKILKFGQKSEIMKFGWDSEIATNFTLHGDKKHQKDDANNCFLAVDLKIC